jgi:hypothetical protein
MPPCTLTSVRGGFSFGGFFDRVLGTVNEKNAGPSRRKNHAGRFKFHPIAKLLGNLRA